MNYDIFCANIECLKKEEARYNKWRVRTQAALLSNLAPRIDKLSRVTYNGCGFHYAKEQALGKLIHALAIPIKFSANHRDKIVDNQATMILNEVMVESLFKEVAEAEKDVKNRRAEYLRLAGVRECID